MLLTTTHSDRLQDTSPRGLSTHQSRPANQRNSHPALASPRLSFLHPSPQKNLRPRGKAERGCRGQQKPHLEAVWARFPQLVEDMSILPGFSSSRFLQDAVDQAPGSCRIKRPLLAAGCGCRLTFEVDVWRSVVYELQMLPDPLMVEGRALKVYQPQDFTDALDT